MTEEKTKTLKKVKESLKYQFIDSTAITAVVTPIFALFETNIAGISDENSINARLLSTGLNYIGIGRLFSKGLDISRKLFNINPKTSEKLRQLHDASYSVTWCGITQPPFYYAAGVRDLKEIAIGTVVGMGLALVVGGPIGYTIDAFRDLIGLKECERKSYPNLIKRQGSKTKKGLVALVTASAIGITAGIYALTPNKQSFNYPHPASQIVETQILK